MKVLVIAPHMDDEVLGVGGTIARHVSEGDDVHVCFVAHRVYGHKYYEGKNKTETQCALEAKNVLGYKEAKFLGLADERLDACIQDVLIPLEAYINKTKPDIVYLSHQGDNNQDHRAIFQAAMIALRSFANEGLKRILCYEVPSSTEQSPPFANYEFLPHFFVNLEEHLKTTIKALGCYKTEKREFPHPRSEKGLEILAMKRGSEIGFKAAEAFMLLREKLG
jgi:LmbE family N-acetylglucosaminyl deacetylase